MGSLEEQDSSGFQVVSSSMAVEKLMGIHQGATFWMPGKPGSDPLPHPCRPSIVNGLCDKVHSTSFSVSQHMMTVLWS